MTRVISRRTVLAELAGAATAVVCWSDRPVAQVKTPIVVYKDPNCGCCHNWVEYMQANGFTATVTDTEMSPIKVRYKVGEKLQSCHTTIVGGYVVEGHVPASDVRKLLTVKPKGILGLTIPGMPQSAPGMDVKPFQPFTVLTFDEKGVTTVFAKHETA